MKAKNLIRTLKKLDPEANVKVLTFEIDPTEGEYDEEYNVYHDVQSCKLEEGNIILYVN